MNILSQWLSFHTMLYLPFCLIPLVIGSINSLTTTKINYLPNGQIGGYELIINNTDDGLNRFNYGNPSPINGAASVSPIPKTSLPYPPPSGKQKENAILAQPFRQHQPQPVHNYESSFTRVDQRKVGKDVMFSIHNVLTKKTHREPNYPVSSLLMIPSVRYKNGAAEPISLKLAQIGPYAALLVPIEKQVDPASDASDNPAIPDLSKTIKSFVEVKNYQPPTYMRKYSYPLYRNSGRYPPSSPIQRSDQSQPLGYLSGSTQLSQSNSRYNEGIFGKAAQPQNSNLPVDLSKELAIQLTGIGANIYNPSSVLKENSGTEKIKNEDDDIVSQDRKTPAEYFHLDPQVPDLGSVHHHMGLDGSESNTKQERPSGEILRNDKQFPRPSDGGATGQEIDVRLGQGVSEALGSLNIESNKKDFDHSNSQFETLLPVPEQSSDTLTTFPTERSPEHRTLDDQPDPFPRFNPETSVGGLSGVVKHPTTATPPTEHSFSLLSHNVPGELTESSVFRDVSQLPIIAGDLAQVPIDYNHPISRDDEWHLSTNRQDRKYFDHSKPLPEAHAKFLEPTPGAIFTSADTKLNKGTEFRSIYQLSQKEIAEVLAPAAVPTNLDDKPLAGSEIIQTKETLQANFPDSRWMTEESRQALGGSPDPNFLPSPIEHQQYSDLVQKSSHGDGTDINVRLNPNGSNTGEAIIYKAANPLLESDQKYFDHTIPTSYKSATGLPSFSNLELANFGPGEFSADLSPERSQNESFARDPTESSLVGDGAVQASQEFSSGTRPSETDLDTNTKSSFSSERLVELDQQKYYIADEKTSNLKLYNKDGDSGSLAGGSWFSTEPNTPYTQEKGNEMAYFPTPAGRLEIANEFIIRVPSLPEKDEKILTDDSQFSSFQEKIKNPETPPTLEHKQHSPGPHTGSLLETLDGILTIR